MLSTRKPSSSERCKCKTFNFTAYFDTGASGILLSTSTATTFNIPTTSTIYADVGVAGSDNFNVSQSIRLALANFSDGGVFIECMQPNLLFVEDAAVAAATGIGVHAPAAVNTATGVSLGAIYSTLYIGQDAFGIPNMSSGPGSNPAAPTMILITKPDHANPLGQFIQVGWKAYYQAGLLWTNEATDLPHCGVLRCKSTFV